MMQTSVSVGVLAGGQSRRMGRDKALLPFEGQPLLSLVLDRVRDFADDLFIVASDRPEYERFGVPVVADQYPDSGSLGGIYTAIAHARNDYCLVVACDMPFLNPSLLGAMLKRERSYDVLVPALAAERSDQGGRETLETLHAIYSKRCLAPIERRLQAGRYKIIGFFDDVRVERISESELRQYDPALLSFFNANTPEEYAWAAARRETPER